MAAVNKRDLIDAVNAGLLLGGLSVPKETVRVVIEEFIGLIVVECARGANVKIANFGVFYPVQKKRRTWKNPKTGKNVTVPPRPTVRFRAAPALKERL